MIRRNRYGKEFNEKIVMELISGQSSAAQLAQREKEHLLILLLQFIFKKTEHYLKEMRRKEKSSGSISPGNSASSKVVKRLK